MKETKFDILLKPYREDLLKSLSEFVSIPSKYDESTKDELNPFGKPVSDALNYIYELAKKDGFEAHNYSNKVIEILCGDYEENVTILAHGDVVPEGDGWSQDPFEIIEKDGVLTGRGVADDKGPLLASYYALKCLRDNNLLGKYQVRFIVGGNEESGSLGVEYYFNDLKKKQPTYGFSPDAEFPLIFAEKGIYTFTCSGKLPIKDVVSIKGGLAPNSVIEECVVVVKKGSEFINYLSECKYPYTVKEDDNFIVTIQGVSAHGASPALGKNAGVEALRLLSLFDKENDELKHIHYAFSDLEGRGINAYCYSDSMECGSSMNIGIISYEEDVLSVTVNYRYVDTCDIAQTKKDIDEAILPLKVVHYGDSHLLFYELESPLVKTLLKSYQEETGDYDHKPMAIGGGTYAKEANNILAFGAEFPGWNSKMHSIGECVKKEDLFKSMSVYLRAIIELGKLIDEN